MRLRSASLTLMLIAVPWLVSASQPEPAIEVFTPISPEDAATEIHQPDMLGAATELAPAAKCHPTMHRAAIVSLQWAAAVGEGFSSQRVDISKFRDGFEIGRYDVSRELSSTITAVSLEAPEPGIKYYWRVLTKSPAGWSSSRVGRFEVPVCPWDEPGESTEGAARVGGSASQGESAQAAPDSNNSDLR